MYFSLSFISVSMKFRSISTTRLDIFNWLRLSAVSMVDLRFFFSFLSKRIRSILGDT